MTSGEKLIHRYKDGALQLGCKLDALRSIITDLQTLIDRDVSKDPPECVPALRYDSEGKTFLSIIRIPEDFAIEAPMEPGEHAFMMWSARMAPLARRAGLDATAMWPALSPERKAAWADVEEAWGAL